MSEVDLTAAEPDTRSAWGAVTNLANPSRILDLILASVGIVFVAPLLAMIAIVIHLQDGGPVLFAQHRLGRGGVLFPCFKLRTMVVDADARLQHLLDSDPVARLEWERDHKLRNDPRITAFGNFLRRSSLDEFPQLLNVLRGEMSLVGPRPIVMKERGRYGRWFADYCAVTPGITGLWQVSGRNDISYRRRVAMDVVYSRTKSLRLDLAILAMTIPAVLFRKGSY